MSKYRAYPDYRESGSKWIDKIPSSWKVVSLKHILSIPITDGPHLTPEFLDDGVPFVSAEAVSGGYIDFDKIRGFISEADDELFSQKYRPKRNDVYMIKSGATTGITAIVETDRRFNIWSPLAVMRCKDIYHPRFLLNYLRSDSFQKSVQLSWTFGTQQNIGMGTLENLAVCFPSFEEQQKIANFLDHETAKIDTLIEKQRQLIKLLKEKRQAVISHAVTKGLNPNAPMRDSGVEWLGEVPEHWIVRRLKHTAKLQSGIPKGKDLTGKLTVKLPMLRVANVQDGYLDLNDVQMLDVEPDQVDRYLLQHGDVLMNEGGDNDKLGRGAVWYGQIDPCIHQNHVFAIRPFGIEPEWLDLITRSSYAKFHFYRVAKQSTNLASISATNIKETPLVIPPDNERQDIMRFVKEKIDSFDRAEQKCGSQISLLQERRTALISAAVTGKIDVRNWQPPADLSANHSSVSLQEATP